MTFFENPYAKLKSEVDVSDINSKTREHTFMTNSIMVVKYQSLLNKLSIYGGYNNEQIICRYCTDILCNFKEYGRHIKNHHLNNKFLYSKCGVMFHFDPRLDIDLISNGDEMYICMVCRKKDEVDTENLRGNLIVHH